MNKLFCDIVDKYGMALCRTLHPSQSRKLEEALEAVEHNQSVELDDPFVGLAFDMIMCDLRYQAKQKGGDPDERK